MQDPLDLEKADHLRMIKKRMKQRTPKYMIILLLFVFLVFNYYTSFSRFCF